MSKQKARSDRSYQNEELLLTLLPGLLEGKKFSQIRVHRMGAMKFIDARTASGTFVRFWLKQGWTGNQNYSAVQFGLFSGPNPENKPNQDFVNYVNARVQSAKEKGATHALLAHMDEAQIVNYVALQIDDVAKAYRLQMAKWPRRARNTKTPTLWFEDNRSVQDASCVTAVTRFELPLSTISGVTRRPKGTVDAKKITAEIELRMRQQAFRLRVAQRCGWRCVVSRTSVAEVLDAAHLPGRDWRRDNKPEDGVLIRADLHRLLDRGLAEFREGRFWVSEKARRGEYRQFHNRRIDSSS